MFGGFADEMVPVGDVCLRVRWAGCGPPVLLVHGHPRTGATWHRVAPRLVQAGFSVVVPDMRGYGRSDKVPVAGDHRQQSKRAVADELVALMGVLGHEQFAVVGHDRGAYVASRMALDYPAAVTKLVVLDAVPIIEALERCDERFARLWFHWFFFAQPDVPERVINADPVGWYRPDPELMGTENCAELTSAIQDPRTVQAMLEDYRAGLWLDREADRADRLAGRTVSCPMLLLWSRRDDLEQLYGNPLAVWRPWADDLRGGAIDSGHHMAEENPVALAGALTDFLRPVSLVSAPRSAGRPRRPPAPPMRRTRSG